MEVMQRGGAVDKPILMQLDHCVRRCRLRMLGGRSLLLFSPGQILGG